MKKIILITGTSTGLGMELALLLARSGHTVYATMRDLKKQHDLQEMVASEKIPLFIEQLDVSDPLSIHACVSKIIAKEKRIDVLINNAGAGFLKASEQATEEELKAVTDVNYFGTVRCTNAVLPMMRELKNGHIINISSVGGLVGQPFNELYCAAKFAVEGYTEALSSYLTPFFNINFTIIEPGGIKTEFANTVFKKFKEEAVVLDEVYTPILNEYINKMQGRPLDEQERVYQTGNEVAQVIKECIVLEQPPLRIRTSEWANEFCNLKTQADPDGLKLVKALRKSYFD